MPNIKSAKKRLRQNETLRVANLTVKSKMRGCRRKFSDAVDAKDAEAAQTQYAAYCSSLDKAVKKGVIKKNTATRNKTRGAAKLRELS